MEGEASGPGAEGGAFGEGGIEAAADVLRRHWGHPRFRPAQARVVGAALRGRDVLAVLPTGSGKSVCFQVPALLSPGITVVVSPLISLMEDQVAGAGRRDIRAAALTSAQRPAERRAAEEGVRDGSVALLYAAPERLLSPAFRELVASRSVDLLAVDEAHCISEWGHDFRPSYRRIAGFRRAVARPPVLALTATATPETRADIEASLGMRRPERVIRPVDRPALRPAACRVRSLEAGARRVVRAVRKCRGAAIVYLATRRRASRLAVALRRAGLEAAPYHAGMAPADRGAVQEAFLARDLRVVCATNAFGMGIDHPEVRLVCHLGCPGSLEAYVQETGRAGRDGRPARCLLVRCPGDFRLQKAFLRRSWPSARTLARVWAAAPPGRPVRAAELRFRGPRRPEPEAVRSAFRLMVEYGCARPVVAPDGEAAVIRGPETDRDGLDFGAPARGRRRGIRRLRAMRDYVRTRGCRRAAIAGYFGEPVPECGGCDRCDGRSLNPRPAGDRGLRAPAP